MNRINFQKCFPLHSKLIYLIYVMYQEWIWYTFAVQLRSSTRLFAKVWKKAFWNRAIIKSSKCMLNGEPPLKNSRGSIISSLCVTVSKHLCIFKVAQTTLRRLFLIFTPIRLDLFYYLVWPKSMLLCSDTHSKASCGCLRNFSLKYLSFLDTEFLKPSFGFQLICCDE